MSESNKALVRRYWEEAFSTGNLSVVDQVVSPEFVRTTTSGGVIRGIERGVKQNVTRDRLAFPDFRITVEDMIAEGDLVVVELTAKGTHQGEFHGIPPTGKEVAFGIVSIHRIVDGKIIEERRKWDRMDVMQQLGVTDMGQFQ